MDALSGVIARTRPHPAGIVRAGLVGLVIARLVGAGRRRGRPSTPHRPSSPVPRSADAPDIAPVGGAFPTDRSTAPITVVVPARDEARRIGPLLASLHAIDADVLVVDDDSSDDTARIATESGATVVPAGPLPAGWAGKAHALDVGIRAARTPLVVTLDADTVVAPSFARWVRSSMRAPTGPLLVTAATQVRARAAGERWLHPAMLTTLVYRFGRPGIVPANPNRSMANGQCMLIDRERFLAAGGMGLVADRLVEDIALARTLRLGGHEVAFVDGSEHVAVAGYGSLLGAWRGWGRSLDLAEVSPRPDQLLDLAVLWAALALPLPRLVVGRGDLVDVLALALRAGTLAGTASAYRRRGAPYWASPLADLPVAARVTYGTLRRNRRWKGRDYSDVAASDR